MRIISCLLLFICLNGYGQPQTYSVANAHSHNDYKQDIPFHKAYNAGFGSIEVDIFLVDTVLFVAHDKEDLTVPRKLSDLYLDPLNAAVVRNHGLPYKDSSRSLIILVDIKTDAVPTLALLVKELKRYPPLINSRQLRFVISGNRPPDDQFSSYPPFIFFDGIAGKQYSAASLKRIAMMSDNLGNYTKWKGDGRIRAADRKKIKAAVGNAHLHKKPIRFWNAPDSDIAWRELMRLRIDFINTDHIDRLALFMGNSQ